MQHGSGGWGAPPGAPGGWGGGGAYGPPPGGGYGAPPPGGGCGAPPGGAPYGPPPGGGGWGPPPGFGGGPGGPVPPELRAKQTNVFIMALISCFFGCCALGIPAAVMAHNAKELMDRGDVAGAESKLGTAKVLAIISFCFFAVSLLFRIVGWIFLTTM